MRETEGSESVQQLTKPVDKLRFTNFYDNQVIITELLELGNLTKTNGVATLEEKSGESD